MFKIAFIGQKGIPCSQGGVEKHVEELSVRLARNGYQVFVYTRPHWMPKEYKKYEQVNLVSLPSINTKHLDAISHTFISILHSVLIKKVDIVHLQGVGPSLLAWLPKLLNTRVKVISTVHSPDWYHQKWSFFAQLILKLGCKFACQFADETIAVSRELQRYCLSKHKTDAIYIPNGVSQPEDIRAKNSEQEKILEQFNLQKNRYILVVTRLIKHKGIHYLIEAFKRVKSGAMSVRASENLKIKDSSEIKLVIVGSTSFTQDYQQYLLRLTKDRDDIIFTGIQTGENLDALFRNCYLYCHPSESEGLSISILEAMSYGKAVLVSNIIENLELISGNTQTGAVGFDFKNKNIKDLTHKLDLLINDPEIVEKVGKKAQEYVKLYYNWEEIVFRTEKLYKNLVLIKDKIRKSFLNIIPNLVKNTAN